MKNNSTNFFKTLITPFCMLLAVGMARCSPDTTTGVQVDDGIVNTNEVVTDSWDKDKFGTAFAANDAYDGWDINDDNLLDENEYYTGFYDTWDLNDDNKLDENEWNTSVHNFGLADETWADWDTNADGILDNNEFKTGFADNNYYSAWDLDHDNFLNEKEYSDGLFSTWDVNDDNILDTNEYGNYNTYFGA
ncbi:hypothetical protein [Pontibacter chitinilyticus]|uniref:hypothetical protein n=1 Tax=Pontibacter chitinilyticus TaxID=2674989 RepID=UPI00321ADA1E